MVTSIASFVGTDNNNLTTHGRLGRYISQHEWIASMIVVVSADPITFVPDADGLDMTSGASPLNVALALAGLRQPVGLLTVDDADPDGPPTSFAIATRTGDDSGFDGEAGWRWAATAVPQQIAAPIVAVHPSVPERGPHSFGLDRLCDRESSRTQVTVSLDLRARPEGVDDVELAQEWALRRVRSADVVTANARDLAYLYPGVPATAIAQYWREEGVGCSAIASERDGVLLMVSNGLAYRRTMPVEPSIDMGRSGGAFTAGLLAELAAIGALGSSPRERLADVRPQQWLRVLERADTAARSHAARAQSSRRHGWSARSVRPVIRQHAMAQ
jgi:sugar/nucleoside kinase (ribokinase family)